MFPWKQQSWSAEERSNQFLGFDFGVEVIWKD